MASKDKTRKAAIRRKTKETSIEGTLVLDGKGTGKIKTGLPFLDHMLSLWTKHGLFDLTLKAKGDLQVDRHHTNEDLGIALGQSVNKALGNKAGIRRFGTSYVPMDGTLVRVVIDISGRPFLNGVWSEKPLFFSGSSKGYQIEDAQHLLQAFVNEARVTMHVAILAADVDLHHVLEAIFKAFGRALSEAVGRDPKVRGVPSTKGRL